MKISINNITKIYSETIIFNETSADIIEGSNVAITGENGSGKSTLLQIIAGFENIQEGNIFIPKMRSVKYLKQKFEAYDGTVRSYLFENFEELLQISSELNKLELLMAKSEDIDSLLKKYGKLQEQFENLKGYDFENEIDRLSSYLEITSLLESSYNHLSGGEKSRVELLKILLSDADILCLDEPTNHLDQKGIDFLEDFCKSSKKTIIIVSHDRQFLNNVVEIYLDIENENLVQYKGSYESFREQKAQRFERLMKDYELQQKEIARLKKVAKRYRQWAHESGNEDFFKKAKTVEKRIDRIETIERPHGAQKPFKVDFNMDSRSGKRVLVVKELEIGYDKSLIEPLNFDLLFKERIALIGENGVGKTTLIKTILQELKPLSGSLTVGESVNIGYLSQENRFDNESVRILDFVIKVLNVSEFEARTVLARFSFFRDDVFMPIKLLSGGEQVRLKLLELVHKDANLLILDEPTNHLDLESIEILEDLLNDYEGSLLLISHDRYFRKRLKTRSVDIKRSEMCDD